MAGEAKKNISLPSTSNAAVWLLSSERLETLQRRANRLGVARIEAKTVSVPPRCLVREDVDDTLAPTTKKMLNADEERTLKRWYARQIFGVCGRRTTFSRLKRSPKVSCTAVMLFHRFYVSHSLLEVDPVIVSLCALFLASKIEDEFTSAAELARTNAGLDNDAKALKLENDIFHHEVMLLAASNFDIRIAHPHRYFLALADRGDDLNLIADAADALLLTEAPFLHPPELLALAAALYARKRYNIDLPPPASKLVPDAGLEIARRLAFETPDLDRLVALLRGEALGDSSADDLTASFDAQAKTLHKRLKKFALWNPKKQQSSAAPAAAPMDVDSAEDQQRGLKRPHP